ncbi:MAG: D-glycerate dehydrogenase [Candidatus Cloacimonetes bacterium]|nr:D-glycerate dehydrogenase [Candidatus Cloacimonadota bacterium]
MDKPRILVTKAIPDAGMQRLQEVFDVSLGTKEGSLGHRELISLIPGFDALYCLLTDKIDSRVIEAGKRLKCISNMAVGFNNIDLEAASQRGIAVCNTPGVLTQTTADLTWALLMATARRIVESDRFLRAGKFQEWEPLLHLGQDVYGKTLGIIGMGRIGQAVARRAWGFNMRLIYFDPLAPDLSLPFPAEAMSLEELLKASDFISIHTPLTPQTLHLIGPRELNMMKSSAILINTSRGPVIDEEALTQALKKGVIAAAGLDVYEHEPELTPGLKDLENTVLLAHIGSASIETRSAMAVMAAENAIAIISGKQAISRVV